MEYSTEFQERFWSKVHKTDTCWLWTASTATDGYGQITINGKNKRAPKVSLELHLNRPIANGLIVAHKPVICHNRLCVNPDHLREATRSENSLDMILDGTMTFGKDHNRIKLLTENQIKSIRNDSRSQSQIAKEYNISQALVSNIKSKKTYAWVID